MSLTSRLTGAIQRGVLIAYQAATGTLPRVQFRSGGLDSDSDVELLEPAGLASAPAAGANVLALNIGTDEDHPVVMVQDATNRPTLAAGETAVHALAASGKAIVLGATTIKLGVGATKSVTRQGDTVTVSRAANTALFAILDAAATAATLPPVDSFTGTVGPGSTVVKAVD